MEPRQIRYAITASNQTAGPFAALKRDLGDLSTRTANLGGGFRTFLGGLAGGAAVTVVANFGNTVRRLADDIDALNDASDSTGETVETLSGLEDIARRNGGSLDLVTNSLTRLNKTLNEAKAGSPIEGALKSIGLSAADLRKQAPGDALLTIAQQLNRYENDGNKARLMQELFGKSSKEMAAFLKDLAEAGKINATVTKQQADEAEKFNKQLSALSTNASNAARGLVSEMLPALNDMLKRFETSRREGTLLVDILAKIATFNLAKQSLGSLIEIPSSTEVQRLEQLLAGKENVRLSDQKAGRAENKENSIVIHGLERRIQLLREAESLRSSFQPGQGVNPAGLFQPRIKDRVDDPDPGKKKVSEAERYLEALQRQAEQTEELTVYEKTLRDISLNRIQGIELPGIRQQIEGQAQLVDLLKLWNKQKEAGVEAEKRLLAEQQREVELTKALLDDTTVGASERAVRDIERIRKALRDPANQTPDFALKAIEAIEKIKAGLDGVADQGKSEFDRLADAIEKAMDRSTDAILDFVVEGRGGIDTIFKAFQRDVLRELISDPIRDEMKNAARLIRDAFKDLVGGGNPLADVFKFALSGGGGTSIFETIGKAIIPQFGFANGGRVRAGRLLKVNENGTEGFIPDQDGTVVNGSQMQRAGSGVGAAPMINTTIHVNGDVSAQTVQLLERAMARNNAQLLRSMRLGGAYSNG